VPSLILRFAFDDMYMVDLFDTFDVIKQFLYCNNTITAQICPSTAEAYRPQAHSYSRTRCGATIHFVPTTHDVCDNKRKVQPTTISNEDHLDGHGNRHPEL
jgi:hypothetical protein